MKYQPLWRSRNLQGDMDPLRIQTLKIECLFSTCTQKTNNQKVSPWNLREGSQTWLQRERERRTQNYGALGFVKIRGQRPLFIVLVKLENEQIRLESFTYNHYLINQSYLFQFKALGRKSDDGPIVIFVQPMWTWVDPIV